MLRVLAEALVFILSLLHKSPLVLLTIKYGATVNSGYTNPDIIPERTSQNIHFKKPTAGYAEMFAQMEKDGVISTRGLKTDANLYGELIFDVNSAYFYNHGGYEFATCFGYACAGII